jgi:hypothetical protein
MGQEGHCVEYLLKDQLLTDYLSLHSVLSHFPWEKRINMPKPCPLKQDFQERSRLSAKLQGNQQ